MRVYRHPTTVLFDTRTVAELRKRSAKETLRTGRRVTPSGLARSVVEKYLFGEAEVAGEAVATQAQPQ